MTSPVSAFISVNGTGAGTPPLNYTLDFGKQPAYQVTATKPGFFDASITGKSDGTGVNNGVFKEDAQLLDEMQSPLRRIS
jgi:hypothetical protein